ncbi:MAG: type B 50S ribosomal protein L31 [Planctomycetes bacterium]|nr:type B 50S ribosomal protein L31 [Planctomycetota bacterium]
MKKGIHHDYRLVVFQDKSAGLVFLCRSTVKTPQTIVGTDGEEYPLFSLDISSASHPFFTGKIKFMDTTGRVENSNKKYSKFRDTKEPQ